jgi:hypothetical protein
MRKLLYLALLFIVAPLYGQTTSVTATLTDTPDGILWVNGTCSATLLWSTTKYPTITPYRKDLGPTVLVPQKPPCTVNSSGVMSVTVTDVAFIVPPNSTWQFSVCPNVYQGNTGCGVTQVQVTGASIDLTGVLKVPSPRVGGGIGAFAYADTEVAPLFNNFYWNTTTNSCRQYQLVWGACASGSGSVGSVSGTANQIDVANGTTNPVISLDPNIIQNGTIKLINPGVFSNTVSSFPFESLINGCDPQTIFTVPQYSTNILVAAVTGCASGPTNSPGIAYNQTTGGFFAATASGIGTGTGQSTAVGVYTTALITGNNTRGFGANPLVVDFNDSATGQQMAGMQVDVQPQKASSAYAFGGFGVLGTNYALFNQGEQGGTYGPVLDITATSYGTPAYWGSGMYLSSGSLCPNGCPVLYNNPFATAVSGTNYGSPPIAFQLENYFDGTQNQTEGWIGPQSFPGTGNSPTTDSLVWSHFNGPGGQVHNFDLSGGIQLELDGSSSGSAFLAASSTGGGLNVTAPGGIAYAPAGTFSNTVSDYVNMTTLNGANCQALFEVPQFTTYQNVAVSGCSTGPANNPGTAYGQTEGGFFAASASGVGSGSGTSRAVGASTYGIITGNNTLGYGLNALAEDFADSATGQQLIGAEFDVQPQKLPSAYNGSGANVVGLHIAMYNQAGTGGTFGPAIVVDTHSFGTQPYFSTVLNVNQNTVCPTALNCPILNVNAFSTATSGANQSGPVLANQYEAYWNGTASVFESWRGPQPIPGAGTNPTSDKLVWAHSAGPSGQVHNFDLSGGIQLELDGSTSGSAFLAASTTGGALNITAAGGVGLPAVNQPAASTWAGSCSMATATSCTVTLGYTFTTPLCTAILQGTGTVIAGECNVSGSTATITAASSNSGTWAVMVFGNPT